MADSKKKLLFVFGTRPEAIKMIPVVKAFKAEYQFDVEVCVTGQHKEMLEQVLTFFKVTPDYDLAVMRKGQTLNTLTISILEKLEPILQEAKPDLIFVHGDTSTSFVASLAAFYQSIPVAHVEAGLRTWDIQSPFPEELNRQLTGRIAKFHFAPTPWSKENLLKENIPEENILVTGNTVIDALHLTIEKLGDTIPESLKDSFGAVPGARQESQKTVLITGHRRENFGDGLRHLCEGFKTLANQNPEVQFIYPVHLNPNVLRPVHEILGEVPNFKLIEPLSYPDFIWLMNKSDIIVTDSGGIQEEAPGLGKPVLVTREVTERPEAVKAGTVKLIGTDADLLIIEVTKLINDKAYYETMARAHNPYGDGKACAKIIEFIANRL